MGVVGVRIAQAVPGATANCWYQIEKADQESAQRNWAEVSIDRSIAG
jgi:hypothetical protein